MFYSYIVLLICVNETISLIGNLPYFKIRVNCFMAPDDSPCANVTSKCTLWQTEKAMAPHSSTLAWKIPWMEEPGRLQSMGSLRVGYDWATSLSLFTFIHWRSKWQPTPVFFPGESQGQGEPGGLPSMWSHRVGQDWSDLAAVWYYAIDWLCDLSLNWSFISFEGRWGLV